MKKATFIGTVVAGTSQQEAIAAYLETINGAHDNSKVVCGVSESSSQVFLTSLSNIAKPLSPVNGSQSCSRVMSGHKQVSQKLNLLRDKEMVASGKFELRSSTCTNCDSHLVADNPKLLQHCIVCGSKQEDDYEEDMNVNVSIVPEDEDYSSESGDDEDGDVLVEAMNAQGFDADTDSLQEIINNETLSSRAVALKEKIVEFLGESIFEQTQIDGNLEEVLMDAIIEAEVDAEESSISSSRTFRVKSKKFSSRSNSFIDPDADRTGEPETEYDITGFPENSGSESGDDEDYSDEEDYSESGDDEDDEGDYPEDYDSESGDDEDDDEGDYPEDYDSESGDDEEDYSESDDEDYDSESGDDDDDDEIDEKVLATILSSDEYKESDFTGDYDSDSESGEDYEQESMDVDLEDEMEVDLLGDNIGALASASANPVQLVYVPSDNLGETKWFALVNDSPVAVATKQSVGQEKAGIFTTDAFRKGTELLVSQMGVTEGLVGMGFKSLKLNLPVKTIVNSHVATAIAAVNDEASTRITNIADDVRAALATAAVGINKGFFSNLSNPIKVQLFDVLSAAGLKNAETLIDAAFESSADEYHRILLSKSFDLMNKPVDARNEISKAVANASYQRAGSTESSSLSSSIGNRLSRIGTPNASASASMTASVHSSPSRQNTAALTNRISAAVGSLF